MWKNNTQIPLASSEHFLFCTALTLPIPRISLSLFLGALWVNKSISRDTSRMGHFVWCPGMMLHSKSLKDVREGYWSLIYSANPSWQGRQPCWLGWHTDIGQELTKCRNRVDTPLFFFPFTLHNCAACHSEKLTLQAKQNTTKSTVIDLGEDNNLWRIQQVNNWLLKWRVSPNRLISWECQTTAHNLLRA